MLATHLVGGEITWECLGNGQFQFELKLFRDCSGQVPNNTEFIKINNHSSLEWIEVNLIGSNDLSQSCDGIGFDCSSGNSNAIEEYIYRSQSISIPGIAPDEGYVFTFNECCRNSSLSNISNPSVAGMTLRAVMYSFEGRNSNACFDSSPKFGNLPPNVFCSGEDVSINHLAYDLEQDSLVYFFAQPLDSIGGSVCSPFVLEEPCVNYLNFNSSYSYNSPLPNQSLNSSNIPVSLDDKTGQITFNSLTLGSFNTVLGVKSFRCGSLIAEVYREVQLTVLNCGVSNNVPSVNVNGQNFTEDVYELTVEAGELIDLDLEFLDVDPTQDLTLKAYGNQFGSGFNNPSAGCTVGTCATLTNEGVQQNSSISSRFTWQTSCEHISNINGCEPGSNNYLFVVGVQDDVCPIPGRKELTISITVENKEVSPSTTLDCIDSQSGSNILNWTKALDNEGTFSGYSVNYSNSSEGPYNPVQVSNIDQIQFDDVNLLGLNDLVYYYLTVNSGCHGNHEQYSDTLSNIVLNASLNASNVVELSWNQPYNSSLQNSITYSIERSIDGGTWLFVSSTNDLSFSESIRLCGNDVDYRVSYSSGDCFTFSNIASLFMEDLEIPGAIDLDSVSYNSSGNLLLGWEPSQEDDVKGYIVYRFNGTVWNPIDTIEGRESSNYESSEDLGQDRSEQLRIAPMDSCLNTAPMGEIHESLYLTSALNRCDEQLLLDWEDYIGWTTDSIQLILLNEDSQDSVFETIVGATEIVLENLENQREYCFYLRAFGEGSSSRSNSICLYVDWLKNADFHRLASVTVDSSEQIAIELLSDADASYNYFNLYHGRSDSEFTWLKEIPKLDTSYYLIYDLENDPLLGSHYYYITAVDICDREVDTTVISRNIDFRSRMNRSGNVELRFNSYLNWTEGVEKYEISRTVNGSKEAEPFFVIETSKDSVFYLDEEVPTGNVCYELQAIENIDTTITTSDSAFVGLSKALLSCTNSYTSKLLLPTVFSPGDDGFNDLFTIEHLNLRSEDFQFVIYSRGGFVVKEFQGPFDSWNGQDTQGNNCSMGVYVYYLRALGSGGNIIEKSGHITLVR